MHFNGIKVGSIDTIRLDKNDTTTVVLTVKVGSDVPIRVDSYATLEPQGITGVNYIQITAGTPGKALLMDVTPHGVVPIIQGHAGGLSAPARGRRIGARRHPGGGEPVNRLLSDDTINNLKGAIGDIHSITSEARRRKQLFADADKAVNTIQTAAVSIEQLSDSTNTLVNGDGKRTFPRGC